MAGGQHKLSRRALLAGACMGPVVAAQAARRTVGEGAAWARALACYRRAELGLEAVGRTEDDDVYDRALGRHHRALGRLLRTAAPDLGAVGVKVDLILRFQVFELSFGEAALEVLRGDVWGFAGR